MKLFGTVNVHVGGEEILRQPGFLDKVRKAFGGEPNLRTGKVRASLEATAVVDAVRDVLRTLGVSNAVSLMVDDIVLFHDRDGRADDLGDLFIAFHEQESVLGAGFDFLRLAVEHVEAGLHLVLEVQAQTKHAKTDAAVRIVISGRIQALEPRPGEDAETYRARVEPLVGDRGGLEIARVQFEGFVARVREAIGRAMPGARAEVGHAEARVERPAKPGKPARDAGPPDPRSSGYDPYMAYYPSPLHSMLSTMMWMSVFSMAMTPHYVVVDHNNQPSGHTDDPGAEHADPGSDMSAGDGDMSHGDMSSGDSDFGGGDFGDFGGFE